MHTHVPTATDNRSLVNSNGNTHTNIHTNAYTSASTNVNTRITPANKNGS